MQQFSDADFSVSKVYGIALAHAIAKPEDCLAVEQELHELVAYMDQNAEFAGFVTNPVIDQLVRATGLEKMFRGKLNDVLVDALQVINRRGRLELLPCIAEAFTTEMGRSRNELIVQVRTAVPLTDALRVALKEAAKRRTGREPVLREHVDPELIGGVSLLVDGQKLDATVSMRLKVVLRDLEERALRELSARAYLEGTLA